MRVALLSLVELVKDADGAMVPRGLLPFGPGTLAMRQLDLALALGCERVICLGQSLSPGLIELQRVSERAKAQFHFVRGARNVSALVKSGDELLVQADGLLADPDEARKLLSGGSTVVILPVAAGVAQGFERIDLNRAWGGAMILPGALAERLFDLPEDTDPTAALLRIALQARVPERELPEEMVGDSWTLIRSGEEAAAQERRWVRRTALISDAFSPAGWVAAQAMALQGTALVQRGIGSGTLAIFSVLLVMAALLSGSIWYVPIGLILFALAVVILEAASSLRRIEGRGSDRATSFLRKLHWLYDLALALLMAFGVSGIADWQTRAFTPLVVVGMTRLVPSLTGNRWARIVEDRALLALFAAMLTAGGHLLPALRGYALVLLALAILVTRSHKEITPA